MSYLAFACAVFLLIISPGPIVSLVISQSQYSIPKRIIAGTVISAQILLAISFLLLMYAININGQALNILQGLGGLYLLYIATHSFYEIHQAKEEESSVEESVDFWMALKLGLSNPKDILFLVAFLPSFIVVNDQFTVHAICLMLIWLAIDISIMLMYSVLANKIFQWKSGQKVLTIVPCFTILAFGCIALWQSVSGLLA